MEPGRRTLAVASGKGGVGKSTVSLNTALALAESGAAVGVLDADLYGPDIPRMVNLTRLDPAARWDVWRRGGMRLEPVERYGLRIMSAGFLLAETQMFPGAAPTLAPVLRQLLHEVDWGRLDYLVIDLPPGTADLQQELADAASLTGALVVVTPQDVAHLDAKKVVELFRDTGVRVLGGVENMAPFACPHCGESVELFPRAPAERSIWSDGVERLASVPFDGATAAAGDRGVPIVVERPASPQADAFRALARAVAARL